MKTTLIFAAIISSFLLLMGGCQTSSEPAGSAPSLTGTQWVLTELNGERFTLSEGLQLPTLMLDAAKGQVSGNSGLNRFAGSYELDGKSLKFGPLMGTRRAGPPAAMAAENAFLTAMSNTRAWRITNQMLELTDGEKSLLKFKSESGSGEASNP